ncbi:MAG: tetratricopeptide repeat protein [Clostridiales bacterium]|nr:tetratricopeptide repeat protein [Clostridiales bacterium]
MQKTTDKGNKNGKILNFTLEPSIYAKRGDAKRAQNDPVSALSLYNDALNLDPHDLDTRLSAAELLTDMSRFNDSNRMLIPYMHEDPDFCKDSYCMVGFNLMGMGEFEGARSCFNRFLDMTDEVSERTDAMLDALDFIDSLDEEPPLVTDAVLKKHDEKVQEAHAAFDRGEYGRSAALLRELVKADPDNKKLLYDLALSCLCSHEHEEGAEHIDRLLRIDPGNWPAWSLKLMYAKAQNNEIEIGRICRELEKCDTEQPDELLRINGALMEADCTELASVFAKRLVRLMPYDTLANHRLAICHVRKREYAKAAEIYGKLLRIDRNDCIAKFYRAECLEAERDPKSALSKRKPMIQYQLPFDMIIARAKELLDSKTSSAEQLAAKWREDEDLRETVRWAFTLHEFNITHAMMNLLRVVGGDEAEHLIRETMADIDAGRSVVNEGMGILKRMEAEEPYFAMLEGSLLEGKVNIIDMSNIRIPKQYCDIFPRFHEKAANLYSAEIINTAAGIVERFIANTGGVFPKLTDRQSEALSAAVEYLACDQCGAIASDDVFERYGVTRKRLMNAIERIVRTVVTGQQSSIPPKGDPE